MKKKNVHEISVKIEGKEWTDAVDKAFKEKQKTAKVDGFRKGKVPRRIYEKKFGVQSLYMDAIENITHDAYFKVLEESKPFQESPSLTTSAHLPSASTAPAL